MSLDRLTLTALIQVFAGRVVGKRIDRVRPHGARALRFDLSSRDALFIDVSREASGVWLVPAKDAPKDSREAEGPSRNAALLFRKHLEGHRINSLATDPTRCITVSAGPLRCRVRPHSGPGATLFAADGARIAHFGSFGAAEDGTVEGPVHDATITVDQGGVATFLEELASLEPEVRRVALAARDPGLLPLLKCFPATARVRQSLADIVAWKRPVEIGIIGLGDDAGNADRFPCLVPWPSETGIPGPARALDIAARFYVAVRRAILFKERRQATRTRLRADLVRLRRLSVALDKDRERWPDPDALRRGAEALLSSPRAGDLPEGNATTIRVRDPRDHSAGLDVAVKPFLTLAQNADAMYSRARSIEKQRTSFDRRRAEVATKLARIEEEARRLESIRTLEDLEAATEGGNAPERAGARERPRYLTSRGLEIVFGRNAAENHEATFKIARREDVWLHVLDAPGAHVILRNRDGRANREDITEAAEVAAFLSERRSDVKADVQYTERKHVQPGGGKGRVRVAHAETIRVTPKDPAGRLRVR